MTQSSSLITADSSTLIASQLTFSNGIGGNFLKNALHGSSYSSKSRATSGKNYILEFCFFLKRIWNSSWKFL